MPTTIRAGVPSANSRESESGRAGAVTRLRRCEPRVWAIPRALHETVRTRAALVASAASPPAAGYVGVAREAVGHEVPGWVAHEPLVAAARTDAGVRAGACGRRAGATAHTRVRREPRVFGYRASVCDPNRARAGARGLNRREKRLASSGVARVEGRSALRGLRGACSCWSARLCAPSATRSSACLAARPRRCGPRRGTFRRS